MALTPTENTKSLGMYFNQHLDWSTQRNYAVENGTKWTAQIRWAPAPSWGHTPKHACQLYISVTIPRTLYAVDVWGAQFKHGAEAQTAGNLTENSNELTSVQRAGTLAIMEGLRSLPTDALDMHAFLLLMHLKIEKHSYRAASCIALLLMLHPLYKLVRKCTSRVTKRHKSTLHDLVHAFNIKPNTLETLSMMGGNPAMRHKQPFKLTIASDKKASVAADKEGRESIKVYSDGSAQEGKVGAAAVLIQQGKDTHTLHYHLGTTEHHTMFKVELVGLILVLHLIKMAKTRTSYALGADNQAALAAVSTPGNRSGHYLVDIFLTAAFNLQNINGMANYSLRLGWTAGHVNIKGNELMDKEAKKAVQGTTSEKTMPPKVLK